MRLNEINVADEAQAWQAMGFTVVDGYVPIGRSFRLKLSGGDGSGVLDYTFGDAGQKKPITSSINGLKTTIAGLPDYLAEPLVKHRNRVIGSMKIVILADDTDATSSQLQALMPALGEPDRSNTSDTGIRYDYWTALDDTHFEVVSMKQEVATDTVAVIFLVVDDLDAAIQVFGEDNVSEKSVYGRLDTVQVKPGCGISAPLRLIAKDAREQS